MRALLIVLLLFAAPACATSLRVEGVITQDTAKRFVGTLATVREPVTVFIDSPGGNYFASVAIADALERLPFPSTCIVETQAASGAFLVLQSCTRRVASPLAVLMTHEVHVTLPEEETLSEADALGLALRLHAMNAALAQRLSRRLGMGVDEYRRRVARGDWSMTAAEALAAHAVDEVAP